MRITKRQLRRIIKEQLLREMNRREISEEIIAEEAKIICPACGHENNPGVKKCSNCGHPRSEGKWKEVQSETNT